MHRRNFFVVLLLAVFLSGCATPYRPGTSHWFSSLDGYFDEIHAEDRYTAVFTATPDTTEEAVRDMVVMRAAELTLMHGYRYFAIERIDVRRVGLFQTEGYGPAYGGKFLAKCSVFAFHAPKREPHHLLDAREVFDALAKEHDIQKDPNLDKSTINRK